MASILRDGTGVLLVLISVAVLAYGVGELRAHDHVAAILLVVTGLSLLRAGRRVAAADGGGVTR